MQYWREEGQVILEPGFTFSEEIDRCHLHRVEIRAYRTIDHVLQWLRQHSLDFFINYFKTLIHALTLRTGAFFDHELHSSTTILFKSDRGNLALVFPPSLLQLSFDSQRQTEVIQEVVSMEVEIVVLLLI